MKTPDQVVQDYMAALSAGDSAAVSEMFHSQALCEIPMLKPNRLIGLTEICKGHEAIFATLEDLSMTLGSSGASGSHVIGEGEIATRRKDGTTEQHQAGLVAEVDGEKLQRLSLYFDARNLRLWSDKAVM